MSTMDLSLSGSRIKMIKKQLSSDELNNSVLIACEMQKKELLASIAETSFKGEVLWLKKSLHEKPKRLNKALQEAIDSCQGKSAILLGFGMCGNGVMGLVSRNTSLIIPMFDDCIRMLLSPGENLPIPSSIFSLFFTEGWLESDECLLKKTNIYDKHYGREKGEYYTKMLLESYNAVTFIDTGLYDIKKCEEKIRYKCELCELKIKTDPGNTRVYKKLLSGIYDSEFVVKAPGEKIEICDFDSRAKCSFN